MQISKKIVFYYFAHETPGIQRLYTILNTFASNRSEIFMNTPILRRLRHLFVACLLIRIVCVAGAQPTPQAWDCRVIEAGKPELSLEGATFGWTAQDHTEMEIVARTDEAGHCLLKLPAKISQYSTFYVQKEGYLTVMIESLHGMPSEHVIELIKAKPIGGIVTDENGQPIEGAEVKVDTYLLPEFHKQNERAMAPNGARLVRTDREGRWVTPVGSDAAFMFRVLISHPDYCTSDSSVRARDFDDQDSLAPLYDRTYQTVLSSGIPVIGQVVDASGNPVSDVNVSAGHGMEMRQWRSVYQTQSDASGNFSVRFLKDTQQAVLFKKDGFIALFSKLSKRDASDGFSVQLKRGTTVEIHVKDAHNHPLAGAYVRPGTRDVSTLFLNGNTNQDGVWKTASAPDSILPFTVTKPGFQSGTVIRAQGSETPKEIVLKPQPSIEFVVKDAQTSQAIAAFSVKKGSQWQGVLSPFWDRESSAGKEGHLQMQMQEGYASGPGEIVFMVEADGYRPVQTKTYKSIEKDISITIELKKASKIKGIVRGNEGKPLKGALVIRMERHKTLGIEKPGYGGFLDKIERGDMMHVFADDEGRFEIPPGLDTRVLLAISPDGIGAVVDLDESVFQEIEIRPFAVLKGQIKSSTPPTLVLKYPARNLPENLPLVPYFTTQVDSDGAFVFDQIPYGHYELGRSLGEDARRGRQEMSVDQKVELKPGAITSVSIGKIGISVQGQAVLAGGLESEFDWSHGNYELSLAPPISEYPMPYKYKTDEAFQKARKKVEGELMAFVATEEGKAFMKERKDYPVRMQADGKFESLEVPPGRYFLRLKPLTWESLGGGVTSTTPLGMGGIMVTVPADSEASVIDIGQVEVGLVGQLAVGKKAPDFELKDEEGNPVRLSDFKGKFVFLDFWSTTCGPCIFELPALREAYEAFKDQPNFVMLALSLDDDWEAIRRFKRKQSMPWQHVRVGPFGTSPVLDDYGVYGIPENYLISPDGIVLQKSMRGHSVFDAISKVLSK